MASMNEIRAHIRSVEQTLKITNAMYLFASSNLRKARKQLTDVEPFFRKIESTITCIIPPRLNTAISTSGRAFPPSAAGWAMW